MKRLSLTIALLSFAITNTAYAEFYRYKNAQGQVTLTTQISQQHTIAGYEILDNNMRVLQVIPAFNEAASNRNTQRIIQQQQQSLSDKALVNTYFSSASAQKQLAQKVAEINSRLTKAKISREAYLAQQIKLTKQAGKAERLEKPVPPTILANLGTVAKQIQQVNASIQDLEQSKMGIKTQYESIINSLKQIERN